VEPEALRAAREGADYTIGVPGRLTILFVGVDQVVTVKPKCGLS